MLYNGYKLTRCKTTGNYSVTDPKGNRWSDSFCNIRTAKKYVHYDIADKRAIEQAKKSTREIHRQDALHHLRQVGFNCLTEYEQELVTEVLE